MANGLEKNTGFNGSLLTLQEWALKNNFGIDGVQSDQVTLTGVTCPKGEKNFENESGEIVAMVFGHWSEFSKTLQNTAQDPFKKIGLDLSWLQTDPSGKDVFKVTPQFQKAALERLPGQLMQMARDYNQKLNRGSLDAENGVQLLRYALAHSDLKLLPYEDQKTVIDRYLDMLQVKPEFTDAVRRAMKVELGNLRMGNTMPKVASQDAALKGKALNDEAEELRKQAARFRKRAHESLSKGDEASAEKFKRLAHGKAEKAEKLTKKAETLLEASLQLDAGNALAYREMARNLYAAKGMEKVAKGYLIEAIRHEKSILGQFEIVELAGKADSNISDAWKFFDEKMVLLDRKAELAAIHGDAGGQAKADPEKEFYHYKIAFAAGNRDDYILERLAAHHARHKDFDSALKVGEARLKLPFHTEDVKADFEIVLSGYARDNKNPILAHNYLAGIPDMPFGVAQTNPRKADALIELYSDPQRWIKAAELCIEKGDYLRAKENYVWAMRLNRDVLAKYSSNYPSPGHPWAGRLTTVHYHQLQDELKKGHLVSNDRLLTGKFDKAFEDQIRAKIKEIDTVTTEFPARVSEAIQAERSKLETATGSDRDAALLRLQELSATQATVTQLDYLQGGLSDNPVFKKLIDATAAFDPNPGRYAEPVAKFTITKEKLETWEKDYKAAEAWVKQHPELDTYLAPHLKVLRLDFQKMRASLANGEEKSLNYDAEQFATHLRSAASPGIRHALGVPLHQARTKIAAGVLKHNDAMLKEGVSDLRVILEYQELEGKKEAAYYAFAALYPSQTRQVFLLEIDRNNPDVKRDEQLNKFSSNATLDSILESPAPKFYKSLKTSGKDPALLKHMDSVFGDLYAGYSATYEVDKNLTVDTYKFYDDQGRNRDNWQEKVLDAGGRYRIAGYTDYVRPSGGYWPNPPTAAELKKLNDKLRPLYGGPENAKLLQEISQAEQKEQLEKNDGFRVRNETGESMAILQDFIGVEKTFAALAKDPTIQVPLDQIVPVRDLLLQRGNSYKKHLEEEIKLAMKVEEKDRPLNTPGTGAQAIALLGSIGGGGGVNYAFKHTLQAYEPGTHPLKNNSWQGPKEIALRAKLAEIDSALALHGKELGNLEKMDSATAIRKLEATYKTVAKYEEAHLKSLLARQTEMVAAIPGSDGELSVQQLKIRLEVVTTKSSAAERLRAFQSYQGDVDSLALKRSVKARLAAVEAMRDEVETNDDIVSAITPGTQNTEISYIAMKKNYQRIYDMLNSGDPKQVAEARTLFLELEQSGRQIYLKENYEDAAFFNQFTIGVGIVIASALTAGLASGAVGLLGGGALLKGFTMAAVFTLSTRVYRGAVYNGWDGVGQAFKDIAHDPLGFTEELLLNWAMFGVINKANKVFLGFYAARVEATAVRSLVGKGVLQEGAKITEEFLAKNPAIKAALDAEMTQIQEGVMSIALQKGGAFVTEVLTFQTWEFTTGTYQMIKKGDVSADKFWEVTKHAFAPSRVLHGGAFLLALKGGGIATMPLTKLMEKGFNAVAMAKVQKQYESFLTQAQEAETAAVKLFETGAGDVHEVIRLYKKAAESQKALLKLIPADALNPAAVAFNEAFLKQLEAFEKGAPGWEKIFSPINEFGLKQNEQGILHYTDGKGADLLKALGDHPWVSNLKAHPNGVLEFTYNDPMNGRTTEVQVLSEGKVKAKAERDAQWAMQEKVLAELSARYDGAESASKPIEAENKPSVDQSVNADPQPPPSPDTKSSVAETTKVGRPSKRGEEAKPADADKKSGKEDNTKVDSPGGGKRAEAMAAQPAEALSGKPEVASNASAYNGTLTAADGSSTHTVDFANRVYPQIKIGNVTLVIHQAKAANGSTVYRLHFFGPEGAVRIQQGAKGFRNVPSAQPGKGVFEISLRQKAEIEVNGQRFFWEKPELSIREIEAKRVAEDAAAIQTRRAERAAERQTSEPENEANRQETTKADKMPVPTVMEVGGTPVRMGDGILQGTGSPLVFNPALRTLHNLFSHKGKLNFNSVVGANGKPQYFLTFWGEEGAVQVQAQGKGRPVNVANSGKYGEKSPVRHELKDKDVVIIDGDYHVFRTPDGLEHEARYRQSIKLERETIAAERQEIAKEPDAQLKIERENAVKAREEALQKRLEAEQRTPDGIPFAELMPKVTKDITGSVFDGNVKVGDKKVLLFKTDGTVDPVARKALHAQVVAELNAKGMKVSSDNAKSVDSIIDLALTARRHGIVDAKGGLTRGQFNRLINELYLHQSPAVRIGGAELTHVPMVVEGTLGFLEAQNPKATAAEKRVAFVTALFHDAGKWDPNLRTQQGYTYNKPHPFFNPDGKSIEVKPGESFNEALDRHETEGKLSKEERDRIKMPGVLISVIVHHDSKSVKDTLTQLETEGVLQKGEAEQAWKAIESHGLVSSWILNNSFGGIGVLSHVFTQPGHARYVELYQELTNQMLKGEKVDLSADTMDPRVIELRKIFAEKFSPLDRAMLLGDHQGQIDVSKYMGILATSPANKGAKIWQVLLGGDRLNSVDGVLKTHTEEQILLMPETGKKAAEDFRKADAWMRQMDPTQPGLAQAILNNPGTQKLMSEWATRHSDQTASVENWLKSEDMIGPDGKPSPAYEAIKQAAEKAFYDHFFVEGKDKLFDWERSPDKAADKVIELSDKDLEKLVVEEEHTLTEKDIFDVRDANAAPAPTLKLPEPQNISTVEAATRQRVRDALQLAAQLKIPTDHAYSLAIGRAAAEHAFPRAEAEKIFKTLDSGLNGVTDFAAYGIARRALFLEVLEGRVTMTEAQGLATGILKGKIRLRIPENPSRGEGNEGYVRPFVIESVPEAQRQSAMQQAHVQRAISLTRGDQMDMATSKLRQSLLKALERGEIDLLDLYRASGVDLSTKEIKSREFALGFSKNAWLDALMKDPKGFKTKLSEIHGEEIFLDSAALEQLSVKAEAAVEPPTTSQPKDKGPAGAANIISAITVGLGILFSPQLAHAATEHVNEGSPRALEVGLAVAALTGIVGLGTWLYKKTFATEGAGAKIVVAERPHEAKPVPQVRPESDPWAPQVVPETAKPQAEAPRTTAKKPIKVEDKIPEPGERTEFHPAIPGFGSVAAKTHSGTGKKVNEDEFLVGKNYAVVFDGMGGMGFGVEATQIARDAVKKGMETHGDLYKAMVEAGEAVNASPYAQGGAVAVGYKIHQRADGTEYAEIIHVGDAGAAVTSIDAKGEREMVHRTRDQGFAEMTFRREIPQILNPPKGAVEKDLDPAQSGGDLPPMPAHPHEIEMAMANFQYRNVVNGGLGSGITPRPVRTLVNLQKGSRILLFTDGIGDNTYSKDLLAMDSSSKGPQDSQAKIFGASLESMRQLSDVVEEFTKHPGKKRLPFTGPNGEQWWIGKDFKVYDKQKGGSFIATPKPDNLTLLVYEHEGTPTAVHDAPTRVDIRPPAHEVPTRVDIPIAAQPAEAFGRPEILPVLGSGAHPIQNGRIETSRLPNGVDSLELYVGSANSPLRWDRPVIIVDEMLRNQAPAHWAHLEKVESGFRVSNTRSNGEAIEVLINGFPTQIRKGEAIDLLRDQEMKVGEFTYLRIDAQGDLVIVDNPMGMKVGGELLIP